MKKPNRDLLVLFKQGNLSPHDMDLEVTRLHRMLFDTEKIDNLISTHELLDLNTYRIEKGYVPIIKHIRQRKEVPFVFLNCLN
jgi:hypothetical protein